MRKTRHVIAIALVTAALCADRAVVAAPASANAPVARMAVKLANRLSVHLNRNASAVVLQRSSLAALVAPSGRPSRQPDAEIVPVPFSPFQFRLPPPAM